MEKIKLNEICNLKQWKIIPTSDLQEDGYPVYGANGIIGYYSEYNHENETVAITCRGATCGSINITEPKSYVTGNAMCIDELRGDISVKYLYYCLKNYDFNKVISGSAQPQITRQNLEKVNITIESTKEQQKIVKILDMVSSVIDKRKIQLENLDNLIKSRFVEMFGDPIHNPKNWVKDNLDKHCNVLSGYPFSSENYTEKGIKICGGLIIYPSRIVWNECKYWGKIEGYEEYLLQDNDIVMALDRPWISEGFKIAMISEENLPALIIQRTARIRAIDLNQIYLFYCFIIGGFDDHCNVTGSLVPHISLKDIRGFSVMIPPIDFQNQFSTFVQQVDKLKVEVQKSLDETQILFDSLMQLYFE